MQSFRIEDDSMVEAWRRLTHSMAISTLLRGTPYHLQHKKSYFPEDLCKKYGIPSALKCDVQSNEVKNVVKEMTDYALNNYEEIRPLWKKGCVGRNKEFERLILLGSPSLLFLEQLKKRKYDVTGRGTGES